MAASRNIQRHENIEIRIEALRAAARIYTGKTHIDAVQQTIAAAKKYEKYLKG